MLVFGALGAVASPVIAQTVEVPEDFGDAWEAVESTFHTLMRDEGVVGGSLAFVHGAHVLGLATHGYQDLASQTPVDERTIYHWASITKTLTAIAVLQLRDRGLLGLDDPVVDYVPELAGVHNPFGSIRDITIRHLLSHSAGFRGSSWPWGGAEPWHPHEPTEWSQLVAMMPYTQVEFAPGSKWQYSNPGIIFLGRTIEALSGEPFEAYMEKNVLRPLGMETAYYDLTPYHLLPHRSNNYDGVGEERRPNGLDFDTGITVSNGGLNGSVRDLARYLAFLLDDPDSGAAAGVLDRRSLEEMWDAQIAIGDYSEVRQEMALGFFLLHRLGRRLVGHTGSQKAFRSFFYIHPETGTGVIAAMNTAARTESDAPNTSRIITRLRNAVQDELMPLFDPPVASRSRR